MRHLYKYKPINFKKMKAIVFTILSFIAVTVSLSGQCHISDVQVTYTECNKHNQFDAILNFEHQNTSASFKVIGNGRLYGTFHYSDLPVKIGQLTADCKTVYEFVVVDSSNDNCRAFTVGGKKCCDNNCEIKIIDFEKGACNNNFYTAAFGLVSYKNIDSIDIYHNTKFIKTIIHPKNSIVLKELKSSTTEAYNQLVVCANGNTTCCDTFLIPNPCFCNIYDLRSQIIECNPEDSTFAVRLNFNHHLTSDSFNLGGNNTNYGTFAYKDLPVNITGLKFDSTVNYEFVVVDSKSSLCFNFIEIGKVLDCHHPCSIGPIKAYLTECLDNNLMYAYLSFEEKNTSLDGFTIRGNGKEYGNWQYGEHTYKVGPLKADCHTLYEFAIKDKTIEGCSNFIEFKTPLCCDTLCALGALEIHEICEGDKLKFVTLDFDHKGTKSEKFRLNINGKYIGEYRYSDLPIQLGLDVIKNKILEIKVFDSKDEICNSVKRYEIKCLLESCRISDFIAIPLECNEENTFYVRLGFRIQSAGKHGIAVKVNGVVYDTIPYQVTEHTVGPFKGDCKTIYKFIIYDIDNPECIEDYSLKEAICCDDAPCSLSNPKIKIGECIHDKYSLQINFNHSGTSNFFTIKINGGTPKLYAYSDLPVTIDQLNADAPVHFVIRDKEFEKCVIEMTLPSIDCISSALDSYQQDLKIMNDNNILQLSTYDNASAKILDIIDIQGKVIPAIFIDELKSSADIHNLYPGVYIVRIQLKDQIINKRFIKF